MVSFRQDISKKKKVYTLREKEWPDSNPEKGSFQMFCVINHIWELRLGKESRDYIISMNKPILQESKMLATFLLKIKQNGMAYV